MGDTLTIEVSLNREELSLQVGASVPAQVRERSFQLFELLAGAENEPVTKAEIVDSVWAGRAVSDDSITQAVSELRRALAPHGRDVIKTVSGVGYRIAAAARIEGFEGPEKLNWSVAVEPIMCLSKDQQLFLMAKGMSHDLTHYLAQAKVFRVIETQPDTATPQQCSHVVRGTLRQRDEQICTTVSLSDNSSGELLWTQRWDFPASGFFETQESIVQEIANHLANPWSGQVAKLSFLAGLERETEDLDAYACFQRGVAAIEAHSVEGMLVALESLKSATELDPGYGQAWACLSIVYGVLTTNASGAQLTELTHLRIDAARRAFACHPRSATAYLVGAKLAAFEGDHTKAADRLYQAIEQAPWNSDVLAMATGIAALNTDLYDEAVEWGERALELSATKPSWYYFPIGYSRFFREEFARAHEALSNGPQTFPELLAYKAACEMALGDAREAKATVDSLHRLTPDFSVSEYLRSEPWGDAKKATLIKERFLAAGISG